MKKGLTSNTLKIIAIITMLIDHIGYYLYPNLNSETYVLFRTIGRIAMPLFTFLIVQGFLHTKNLIKYIYRIFLLGLITQICISILSYINISYFPNYEATLYNYLNILFSYGLSLIILDVLYNTKIKKYIKIIISALILILYFILPFDYGIRIPFIMIGLCFIEKLCPKNTFLDKTKYLSLILVIFVLSLILVENSVVNKYSMLLSLIFIAFYNGEKGNNNKFVKYSFYAFFPIHHTILYLIGLFS